MSSKLPKTVWVLLLIAGIAVLFFVAAGGPGRDRPVTVSVIHAARQNLDSWTASNGKVEPVEPHIIQSQLTTRIEKIAVTEGQTVKAGDTLMVLDAAESKSELAHMKEQLGDWYTRPRPIDLRYVGDPWRIAAQEGRSNHQQVWLRADGRLPDDPLLHVCVVAYASDMTLLDSVLLAHGRGGWAVGDVVGASLDHAMWFHRPFRADEWLLYDQESPTSHGGRGLGQARIYTQDGQLAISVIQEGLVRVPR